MCQHILFITTDIISKFSIEQIVENVYKLYLRYFAVFNAQPDSLQETVHSHLNKYLKTKNKFMHIIGRFLHINTHISVDRYSYKVKRIANLC